MLEPLPPRLQEHLNSAPGGLEGTVKVEPEDAREEVSSGPPVQDVCDGVKEERSVEMDLVSAGEGSSSASDMKKQTYGRRGRRAHQLKPLQPLRSLLMKGTLGK